MRVFHALARALVEQGVTSTFSLMSDDTAKLVVELERLGVSIVSTRHEHAAVGAADGYARSSGRLGVAVIGRGPGLTNAINALLTATKARSPILVDVGDVEANDSTNVFKFATAFLYLLLFCSRGMFFPLYQFEIPPTTQTSESGK